MKQQTFDSKNIEQTPVLSVELKQGELKFLCSNQESLENLQHFMTQCKNKTMEDADIIELIDGE